MTSVLDDAALVHDDDLVGVADGRETMGDDQAGAVVHEARHGVLDARLRARVDVRGRLVEYQDARRSEAGARDGEKLALTSR